MNFQESDEHALLRGTVSEIACKYGHRYYADRARSGRKIDELWNELAEAGFVGVNIAERYGGGGMGITELAMVCEELGAAGCPLLVLVVSPAICGSVIQRFGSEAQKTQWLPGIASGDIKMAFAITEPDAGSNSHNLATTARRDGDGYWLSGTKHYISAADEADQILVITRSGTSEATGQGELSLFIVDADAEGLDMSLIPVEIVSPENYTLGRSSAASDVYKRQGSEDAVAARHCIRGYQDGLRHY